MFDTIEDIKAANLTLKQHWFDPSTMEFFASQIHPEVYHGSYFISSEQFLATPTMKEKGGQDGPRLYTIRVVDERGWVSTCSDLDTFESLQEAIDAVQRIK